MNQKFVGVAAGRERKKKTQRNFEESNPNLEYDPKVGQVVGGELLAVPLSTSRFFPFFFFFFFPLRHQ